ncbi:unnamed protein product [Albugo candida]|uniref:MORN repeat-containing protein 5 n=1 Tax=Albugo candida TaxID=65357 RepID=A0A024G3H0_9STRA|nr:unnamed protein product [Albugo candida]|eukprot:CCI40849.1 unnamed protein product [Albugo candida]
MEQEYKVQYKDGEQEEEKYLKRAGDVQIVYANGDTFVGSVDSNLLKQGNGKYIWQNPSSDEDNRGKEFASYDGNYLDGVKQGIGKMIFPNGDIYHGEWKDDKMHGEGAFMYANGDIYSGEFEQGIREGQGTYEYAADRSMLTGKWVMNALIDGRWKFKNGGEYIGRFENGKPIGPCVLKSRSGLQIEAEYVKVSEADASGDVIVHHKCINGTIPRHP